MTQRPPAFARHPVLRTLVFERLLLVASGLLAAAALATGRGRVPRTALRGQRRRLRHPIASLANLIGAQLFAREGGDVRAFWRSFFPINVALLVLLVAASIALVAV